MTKITFYVYPYNQEYESNRRNNTKTQWDEYGYCSSCGWHSGFNEVKYDLIEQLEDDDFETDRNGNKYIVAYCKYATDNLEDHRDIEIYINELL